MSRIKELKEAYPYTIKELTRRGWLLTYEPVKEVLFITKSNTPKRFATIAELEEMEQGIISKIENAPIEEINLELKNELL